MNVTDRAGRTSLHHAAFNGHVEVIYSNMYKKISLIIENLINTYIALYYKEGPWNKPVGRGKTPANN